ncbi:HAD family hydrolase [Amylibacter sp.]|nr:HAD family hydrolase [Amylibacter sp.]
MILNKALFLDRDGVVNQDHGYVHKIKDFKFIDGIFDLTRAAISKGYLIFIITNQAGIGRGYFSVSDFDLLTFWMCEQFNDQGVSVSKVYYSPFHPEHGIGYFKKDDMSRKPNPGMIIQAVDEFNINLSESILIGDKLSDIQAGLNAGVRTNICVRSNISDSDISVSCHYIAKLNEAKAFL